MKQIVTVFAFVALMGVAACSNTGEYVSGEPIAQSRQAGKQNAVRPVAKADKVYNKTLAK